MKHVRKLLAGVATTGLALAPAVALADRDGEINVRLQGIQEVPSVITGASGRFTARDCETRRDPLGSSPIRGWKAYQ